MEWLKLHNDIRTDAKVRSMPMAERWIWVALLTYANEQPTRGVILDYDPDILALEIADGDTDILCNALQRYIKLRMIKVENNTITLLNFDKRQARKPSDEREAVKERVARHRARRKEDEDVTPVTPPVTPRNAFVTPIDKIRVEEIREDKEKRETRATKAARPSIQTSYPDTFEVTEEMRAKVRAKYPDLDIDAATEEWAGAMCSNRTKYRYTDWQQAWYGAMRRANEWGTSAKGSKTNGQPTSNKAAAAALRNFERIAARRAQRSVGDVDNDYLLDEGPGRA